MTRQTPGRPPSLEARAYNEIRDMIIRGELKPGEQIVQEELAARLGLSRTPLRRALAELAKDNFIELSPRGGAHVRTFSRAELRTIFEIRAVLEGLVCRLVAPVIEPKHIAYLRSLITEAAREASESNLAKYREADAEFHTYLADLAADPMLSQVVPSYQILSLSLAQGLLRDPAETLPEHLEILDALAARDADAAERKMVEHVRRSAALFADDPH